MHQPSTVDQTPQPCHHAEQMAPVSLGVTHAQRNPEPPRFGVAALNGGKPMPRPHLTTTQRGYGTAHQRAKADALRVAYPTQPCTRCARPLGTLDPSQVHLDHAPDRTHYLGLAHAHCNTSAGAKARHARPTLATNKPTKRSRNW